MGRRRSRSSSSSSDTDSDVDRYRSRKSARRDGSDSRKRPESRVVDIRRRGQTRLSTRSPTTSPRTPEPETTDEKVKRLENMIRNLSRQNQSVDSRSEAPRLSVRSDCIPEFSPENTNLTALQWLMKIDQLKLLNKWDEITTIYHMQSRLVGMARSWYHSLQNYNLTWEEWKALIKRSFPDHTDYATLLQRMLNRRKEPAETMTAYYFAKMELIRTCEVDGKRAVSCLIHGIDDAVMQNGARAGRYQTPEALYEEYLSVLQANVPSTSGRYKEKQTRMHSSDLRSSIRTNFKSNGSMIKCFNCGQRGHIAAKCFKPRTECRECKLLGHVESNCPKKQA